MGLQPGIIEPPQKHATVLVLDLADASALRGALDTLTKTCASASTIGTRATG